MKIYHIMTSALIAAAATTMTSCDDIFRDAPINKISENSVWSNPQLLDTRTHGIAI